MYYFSKETLGSLLGSNIMMLFVILVLLTFGAPIEVLVVLSLAEVILSMVLGVACWIKVGNPPKKK